MTATVIAQRHSGENQTPKVTSAVSLQCVVLCYSSPETLMRTLKQIQL